VSRLQGLVTSTLAARCSTVQQAFATAAVRSELLPAGKRVVSTMDAWGIVTRCVRSPMVVL
jgi:hypothetical protein